jgi:transposase
MRMFIDPLAIYLYPAPVDFRKSFNGLALIVEQHLDVSLMSGALFVFSNRTRKKLKVLYWDSTGLALWNKRLEKEVFKWPKSNKSSITLNEQQLHSLLGGFAIDGHQPLFYASAGL